MVRNDLTPFRKPWLFAHRRPSEIAELLHRLGHFSRFARHPECRHLHFANCLRTRFAWKASVIPLPPAVADRRCCWQPATWPPEPQPYCPQFVAENARLCTRLLRKQLPESPPLAVARPDSTAARMPRLKSGPVRADESAPPAAK